MPNEKSFNVLKGEYLFFNNPSNRDKFIKSLNWNGLDFVYKQLLIEYKTLTEWVIDKYKKEHETDKPPTRIIIENTLVHLSEREFKTFFYKYIYSKDHDV